MAIRELVLLLCLYLPLAVCVVCFGLVLLIVKFSSGEVSDVV